MNKDQEQEILNGAMQACDKIIRFINEQMFDAKSALSKGKYDIDYVINLLKTIEQKCEIGKMNPRDTLFTMRESVRRLLAMLEVEKGQIR